MVRRNAALWLVLAVVAAFYAQVSTAFFCGYDDFTETNRAAFEDAANPSRIFTQTHFGTPKYRPGQRGLTYLSWHWGQHDPKAFRFRNLAFHLLSVALVYGITFLLSRSRRAAAGAALLFGLHPLANQVIVASVFGNTEAYAMLLAAFFLFLYSLEKDVSWGWPLAGCFLAIWLALFTYESTIVVFGFIWVYFALARIRGLRTPPGYVTALTSGSGLVLVGSSWSGGCLSPRLPHWFRCPSSSETRSSISGSLLLPLDSVFANRFLGTPLPSELAFSSSMLL